MPQPAPDFDQLAKLFGAFSQAKAEMMTEEDKTVALERAKRIVALMDHKDPDVVRGVEEIVRLINELKAAFMLEPEWYLRPMPDGVTRAVDQIGVALHAGGREALEGLLQRFEACRTFLEREARRKAPGGSQGASR